MLTVKTVVDLASSALGGTRNVRFQLQGTGAATDVSFVYVDVPAHQLNEANGTDAATRLSLKYDANGAGLGLNLLGFRSLDVLVNFYDAGVGTPTTRPLTAIVTGTNSSVTQVLTFPQKATAQTVSFPLSAFGAVGLGNVRSVELDFDTQRADDFRLGDRIDAGVAVAYRFTEDIKQFPQLGVFAEANMRHLFKSEDHGVSDSNTGGTALFLTPGMRVGFTPHFSFTVSAPLPVVQDLNGLQLKTRYKINAALTLSF